MSERREVQIVEVLIEGRDQEKSHVLLDVARPTPEERASHGYLVAITELSGATPKTAQMVRAWIDFAIERYYASVPQDVAAHFEEILQRLNTQSGLYLRQHPQEQVSMVLCIVHGTDTHLAIHGSPTALLLYRTAAGWRALDLVSQVEQGSHLFSNVLTGTLRPDDRLLLASPHTAEFFTPDRLCKISEGKAVADVNDHMNRVLTELSADVSFGYAWIRVSHVITEDDEQRPSNRATSQKKSHSSMADLLLKTKSTASILAPPVITIPKDKVVTTLLKGAHRGAAIGWQWTRVAAQRSLVAARQSDSLQRIARSLHPSSLVARGRMWYGAANRQFYALPPKRKKIFVLSLAAAVLVLAAGVGLFWQQWALAREARAEQLVTALRDTMRSTDEAFVSQREAAARLLLADAQQQFDTIATDELLPDKDTIALREELMRLSQKVRREFLVTPKHHKISARAIAVATLGNAAATLAEDGTVSVVRNDAPTALATITGAQRIFSDKEHGRFVVVLGDDSLVGLDARTGRTAPITLARAADHTATGAEIFYGGRYYVYDRLTKQIYRYDGKQPTTYDSPKRWITDGGQPIDVTRMGADSSLWLITGNGAPLKYTSGKLQPYRVAGAEPPLERASAVALGSVTTNVYVLDRDRARIVITDRAGALQQQILFPTDITKISGLALDEKETTLAVITENGKFYTAALK